MTTSEPNWDLYRSFLAVMREGSLSGAARELGLTQPTVGRHIETLEQGLGLSLFTRSQAGLIATDDAHALRPHAQALASASTSLLRAASALGRGNGKIHGTVRVTASEVIGVEVLPTILARLRDAHPGITIELSVSNRVEDLLKGDADIAVRMQRPQQDVLIARHIGEIEVGFHAKRDYLERHGTPRDWQELEGHALIGIATDNAFTRKLRPKLAALDASAYALRSDSDLVHLAAIRAGLGIGFCQARLARRDASLVRVMPDLMSIQLDTWLAMHENLRANPACATAFTALSDGLLSYATDS